MKKMISAALILALVFSLCACGETEPKQDAPGKIYPIKSESELMAEAVEIDPIIFSTTGEENGLPGSIFHFEGKVKSSEDFNGIPYLVISTENGDLAIFSPADVLGDPEYFKPLLIDEDYTMPEVGEKATIYALYFGYSNMLKMPTFYLGANKFMADQYRDKDSDTLKIASNEFFADDDRISKYYGLLMNCRYEELYSMLEEYLAGEDITGIDAIKELEACLSELIELMSSCVVTEDSIEGNAKIQYKDALDISAKQCIIPILETSKYTGAMIEYKLGLQKNDWLFFDRITAVAGESKNTCTYKSYEVNRDVLSGGKICEYIYSSGFNLIFSNAKELSAGTIRFENTSTKEIFDHEITETELNAIIILEQINTLHDKLFYAAKSWEDG